MKEKWKEKKRVCVSQLARGTEGRPCSSKVTPTPKGGVLAIFWSTGEKALQRIQGGGVSSSKKSDPRPWGEPENDHSR